jgi:hypothetical protein
MKRLSTSLLVIFLAFLLNGCGEWDNLVDSISGSDDDDAVPTAQTEALPRKDIPTNTKTDTKPDTKTETKTETIPVTKPTTDTSSYPGVAGNGILWKPVSESTGKLAVLLAPSYGVPQVRVLDINKNVLDTGKFVYKSNPNRATYRFAKAGRDFPKPCLLQVGSKIFKVANGSNRYE